MSGSFRLVIMLISFFTSWISARYLGVELKGKYSYLFTISGFVWLVIDMGVYRSFPYFVRKYPEKLNQLFAWSVLQFLAENIILLSLGFVFLNGVSGLVGFTFNHLYMLIFVFAITFSKFNMQLQALYLGMDKIFDHSMAQFGSSMLILILLLAGFFVFDWQDRLAWVLVIMLLSNVFTICYYLRRSKWSQHFVLPDLNFLKLIYTYGFRVFLSSLFILFLMRFDIILIKRMLSFGEVGIYSVAAHIIDILQVASNVVGGLLLVKLTDSETLEQKWHIMRRMMLVFLLVLSAANLGFIVLGKFLLATFFGVDFVPVYYVYLWLIPASLCLSFGSLFNNYLNSKGFPIISIILPAISLVANIIMNILFIPRWGIAGAAIATSIAYAWWFISIIMYEHYSSGKRMLSFMVFQKADFVEIFTFASSLVMKKKRKP